MCVLIVYSKMGNTICLLWTGKRFKNNKNHCCRGVKEDCVFFHVLIFVPIKNNICGIDAYVRLSILYYFDSFDIRFYVFWLI